MSMFWPLPALLVWAVSWAVFWALHVWGIPLWIAFMLAIVLGLVLSRTEPLLWRQFFMVVGFPLSLAITGLGAKLPAWVWLVLLAVLVFFYPWRAWQDAPFFPTQSGVLEGLDKIAPLSKCTHILDAGCGLGHGLIELRRVYLQAQITGVEWSWLLHFVCAWRCPWAEVRRADMWTLDWKDYDLVYLFQRPESMKYAMHKAQAELQPGAYLISLEFKVPNSTPLAVLENKKGKPVWVYQIDKS